MAEEKQEYGILVWTGLRQLQALRDAVTWSLGGQVEFKSDEEEHLSLSEKTAGRWLEAQGLQTKDAPDVGLSLVGMIGAAIEQRRIELLGPHALQAIRHGQRARHRDVKDFGTERSGAGWSDAANFCITSAFLRLLGAWEQYELDVLKSLYYYRPTGESPGSEAERLLIEPELHVVYEQPVVDSKNPEKPNYTFPPEWTNVRKKAGYNGPRAKLLSKKFDIEAMHGDGAEREQNQDQRKRWYDQRNDIAHGRAKVNMALSEYVEVEIFVYRAMIHVADQCLAKHKLLV